MILEYGLQVVVIGVVPEPTVFRKPNQSSYYPGEYVMLICVLDDNQVDEQIVYRWNFTSLMIPLNGKNFTETTLVPLLSDAGYYTCYANTNNKYTRESQGITTKIAVLRKLLKTAQQQVAKCML